MEAKELVIEINAALREISRFTIAICFDVPKSPQDSATSLKLQKSHEAFLLFQEKE